MDVLFTIFVGFIIFVAYYFLFADKKVEKKVEQKETKVTPIETKEKIINEKKSSPVVVDQVDNKNDGCCGGSNADSCCKNNSNDDVADSCCKNNQVEEEEEVGCGGNCSCGKSEMIESPAAKPKKINSTDTIKIVYGTQTGTTKEWATKLVGLAKQHNFKNIDLLDMSTYDLDDLNDEPFIVFLVSTYTGGLPPDNCIPFFDWLRDHSLDWRVDKVTFTGVKFAVFGIGHSIYGENYNAAAKELDKIMNRLTAQRVVPVGLADNGAGVEVEPTFNSWSTKLFKSWEHILQKKNVKVSKTSEENDESEEEVEEGEPLVDLEDLGMMNSSGKTNYREKKPKVKRPKKKKQPKVSDNVESDDEEQEVDDAEFDESEGNENDGLDKKDREMLTPSLRKSLTKQGYKLLGSHSGVKMCRWTKAMLRGRGGCYKHTFYGIKSYQCMEMTPNLACANKCVFCWRHHSNPVGTEWKWKMDQPKFLLDEAIKQHVQMIKQMKGVPGVVEERYREAFTVKHCALSLVGEPIAYPEINKFVDLLHEKEISSFMVTNAQFPEKIDELKPVTQLYISVDAATKESLRAIDRPIFPDFWERFLACMDSLAKKGQRTVYRLTLVKDWNMEELKAYAELIKRGKPSFVEVKGVTYCGTSKASTLTMQNVPFHQEVINFAKKLCETDDMKDDYEVAVEHEHSCAILIPHKKFKVDGVWNTWIDYPKFHQLVKSGKDFDALDYMEPSPDWSLLGSAEKGFDPEEVRFRRNKAYQGSGC